MSANTDDLGERVARIEGTVEQMDKRLEDLNTRMDERFDTLEGRMDQFEERVDRLNDKIAHTRRNIRNWLVLVVLATSAVVGALQLVL